MNPYADNPNYVDPEILEIRREAIAAQRAARAEKLARQAEMRADVGDVPPASERAAAAKERVACLTLSADVWDALTDRARRAGYVDGESTRARGVARYIAACCASAVAVSDARELDAYEAIERLGPSWVPLLLDGDGEPRADAARTLDLFGAARWVPDVGDDARTGARGGRDASAVVRVRVSLTESTRARLLELARSYRIGALLSDGGRVASVLSAIGAGWLAVDGVKAIKKREKRRGEIDLFGDGGGIKRY